MTILEGQKEKILQTTFQTKRQSEKYERILEGEKETIKTDKQTKGGRQKIER
jgi:hypothetical protein